MGDEHIHNKTIRDFDKDWDMVETWNGLINRDQTICLINIHLGIKTPP